MVPAWAPVLGVALVLLAAILLPAPGDAQSDGTRPSARVLHQMVYHAESGRVILFGGATTFFGEGLDDMWTYNVDANAWTELFPSTLPPAVREGHMAYDSRSDRAILFQRGETWAYDLDNNTWTNMFPAKAPPTGPQGRRENPGMAYDSESDRIILFGGRVDHTRSLYDDTWAYDFESNTWTEMQPAVRPPARILAGMAYDAARDRVILFGGACCFGTGLERLADTWAYDYNNDTWTQLNPATAPSPRGGIGLGMIFDASRAIVILFGGVGPDPPDQTNDETWMYDYVSDAWTRMTPGASPGPRAWHGMVYADASGKAILFGGGSDRFSPFSRETWTYDGAANVWSLVDGPEPPKASFTFSPSSPLPGETVVFNAAASSDPDGTIVFLAWEFGDGGSGTGMAVDHVFVTEGTYAVNLTVTDSDGLEDSTTRDVVVAVEQPPELPPPAPSWLIMGGVAAVAVSAVAVVALMLRRRRRR